MVREQQVLVTLIAAKPQSYHFTTIIVFGMGFFTDAYDLLCISPVTKLFGRIYYHVDGVENPGKFKAMFGTIACKADAIGSTILQAEYLWRIILMVGAAHALLTYYWRTKMPKTRYKQVSSTSMSICNTFDISELAELALFATSAV
ncbi:hypothetical protein V6N11_041464 [Hibiscus sabdariffa]|uniref:Uncharacterized protein n=1 Tax=Hibiscus sabdariffa TaxID=183260 RepID=A0ABR2RKL1_9ROSI